MQCRSTCSRLQPEEALECSRALLGFKWPDLIGSQCVLVKPLPQDGSSPVCPETHSQRLVPAAQLTQQARPVGSALLFSHPDSPKSRSVYPMCRWPHQGGAREGFAAGGGPAPPVRGGRRHSALWDRLLRVGRAAARPESSPWQLVTELTQQSAFF